MDVWIDKAAVCLNTEKVILWVACKRWSSVNSGAGLRRFNDITGMEKSCVAKPKKGKVKEKYYIIAT